MRHLLRILSVLLLSLVVGIASAQTLIERSASGYDGLSYSFDTDSYLSLTDGTRLLLRAAGNGNNAYYFAGAAVKTQGAETAEVYVVEVVGTSTIQNTNSQDKTVSTFRLKRESDNNYVKAPTANGDAVAMTATQSEAAVFFAYCPDGVNGSSSQANNDRASDLEMNQIVRLQATNVAVYLNSQAVGSAPIWSNGKGGFSIWALYIAPAKSTGGGDSGEVTPEEPTDTTTVEELQAAIDKANALFATKKLITDASQITSNSKESSEGSYVALIDGDVSTYFHSSWSAYDSSEKPHNLQFTFTNTEERANFTVNYTARNDNNRPTEIKVYGGTSNGSNVTWEESFASLTKSDGLGEGSGTFTIKADASYNALRFDVISTNWSWDSKAYFTYAEFQIYGTDYTTLANDYTAEVSLITALATATKDAQAALFAGKGYDKAISALTPAYDALNAAIAEQIVAKAKQNLIDAIANAQAKLTEAKANADLPGQPSTSAFESLTTAIASAQAVADATTGTTEGYEQAVAILEAAAEAALQDAISFPTDCYFTITNDRGSIVYDPTQAVSNDKDIFVWYTNEVDSTNPNHLWGFYEAGDGNYYLYNVGAKLFANSKGTGNYGKTWVLKSEPSTITLSLTWDGGSVIGSHKVSIKGDDLAMSISASYTGPVITYYADNDGGVPFVFNKSSYTFDQDLYNSFANSATNQADLSKLIAEAKQTLSTVNYKKLINDASQFNSNNKDPKEGSYAALLDGDASTFFHSNWHDQGTDYHDLQVTFEDVSTTEFKLDYEARSGENEQWATKPVTINIYGGHQQADGTVRWETTPFQTHDNLGQGAGGSFVFQADGNYNALRFEVTKTVRSKNQGDGSLYFTYGEFQLYAIGETDVKQTYITALKNAIEAAENASYADICNEQTFLKLYLTLWDANYDVLCDYDAVQLRAAVADARTKLAEASAEQGTPGYLDDASAADFSAIIENADKVANDISSDRDDIAAADTALTEGVSKYYGHSCVSYPVKAYFVITNTRGSIVYDPAHSSSLDANLGKEFLWFASTPDETDKNNLWGFLENATTGEYYLYNVGQQLFANCEGKGDYAGGTSWVFSETPSPITMEGLTFPTLHIKSGDTSMSLSPTYTGPVITYYADGDEGVPFSFTKSSVEFDEDLYLAMADRAGIVTGVTSVCPDAALRVLAGHGCLTLTATAPATVRVVTLSGVTAATVALGAGSATTITLPAGIYVVDSQKVIVK